MEINIRDIKKLIELLEGSTVNEIEVKQGEESIRLSCARGATHMHMSPSEMGMAHHAIAHPAQHSGASQMHAAQNTPAVPVTPVVSVEEGHRVKSPMVGTLYRAASPGAPAFAEVGKRVSVGDTLCIIEAMKMMNHIEADKAGVVKAFLVVDGSPVEYDQPLVVIDTDA